MEIIVDGTAPMHNRKIGNKPATNLPLSAVTPSAATGPHQLHNP
ncbi:MAG: hypothetical protein ACRDRI_23425 [Pseudonocardiaceae bacterium]